MILSHAFGQLVFFLKAQLLESRYYVRNHSLNSRYQGKKEIPALILTFKLLMFSALSYTFGC